MEFILIVAALLLSQNYTPLQAAPSTEPCPSDSVLSADICKCDPSTCQKPPCLAVLSIAANGSDVPSLCCPRYSCDGCLEEEKLAGKCPCAAGAVLDERGLCECVDEEKELINGECTCNPLRCKVPILCDRKSVSITINDGCCKTNICKPCPSDSESTHLESEDIEDHCVCLPCNNDCGNNKTVVIKKHGTGFPGNCCDLYECKKVEENKGCIIGDTIYENGDEWYSSDLQKCKCQNGLSLCSNVQELKSKTCYQDQKIYKHSESWTKEDGCTYCTCRNGEEQCFSHYCDVKESQIQKNDSQVCLVDNHVYQHLETWTEEDKCTFCTCINGEEKCTKDFCDKEPNAKKNECQPLVNCNKTCSNGFKINRKGCEICKCNNLRFGQEILSKYNITMNDLIGILDDYLRSSTSTSTTTTTTTTTSTTISTTTAAAATTTVAPIVTNKNAKLMLEDVLTTSTSTTTEPSIVPTDEDRESESWIWIALLILAVVAIFILCGIVCVYKSRRKSSIDLSHCQYETVNTINNNNTIKKTEQLL